MRFRLLTVVAMLVTAQLFGQQQLDRILVPIHLRGQVVEGAYGSRWTSELRIFNTGTTEAFIDNLGPSCTVPCPTPIPPAKVMDGTFVIVVMSNPGPGVFVRVESLYADQLDFQARVRDLSREEDRWGAWLPVVRESEATTGELHLLSIPIEPGYRQTLRVYSFDSASGLQARVQVYLTDPNGASPDELVNEFVLSLARGSFSQPAYAEAVELTAPAAGREVRVTIKPEGLPFPLWSMVSLTNNVTQDVTMIVPNSRGAALE